MKSILNALLAILILGGAFVLTQWYANAMYNPCSKCGALNAKRRTQCRTCGEKI
jgi:hypothetical protein